MCSGIGHLIASVLRLFFSKCAACAAVFCSSLPASDSFGGGGLAVKFTASQGIEIILWLRLEDPDFSPSFLAAQKLSPWIQSIDMVKDDLHGGGDGDGKQ